MCRYSPIPASSHRCRYCCSPAMTCTAFAQNYVAPSTPVMGSGNTVTANAPVPRPTTQPCTVTLFQNFDFADFNPKPFNYTPPANCPGPWAAVVFEADWSVDAGRQFDRTAEIWIGGANVFFGTTSEPSHDVMRTWHTESNLTEFSPLFSVAQQGRVTWATWSTTHTPAIITAAPICSSIRWRRGRIHLRRRAWCCRWRPIPPAAPSR